MSTYTIPDFDYEAVRTLAAWIVAAGQKLSSDPEIRESMARDPSAALEPDILPRAGMLAFLELALPVASPEMTVEWLRRTADAIEIHSDAPRHFV